MKLTFHTYLLRCSCSLVLLLALLGSAVPAPAAPSSAAQAYQVYLPLIAAAESATPAVQFSFDAGRTSHAAIGPEGGLLTATAANGTRFELTIPAEALDFTEVITMTPASAVAGLPLSGGLAGAVNLEPAGISFYTPATLVITPAMPLAGPLTIGFAFDGTGNEFHLRPTTEASGMQIAANEVPITMEILSIRPVGAGSGTQEDIARQQATPGPTDALDAAIEAILTDQDADSALRSFYQTVLAPDLRQAATNPAMFDKALREFDGWMYFAESRAKDNPAWYASMIAEAKELFATALERASVASADRCYEQKRPEEGFALLRWARYARKYLPGSPLIATIEAKLAKCLKFELTFHSVITESSDGYSYYYELESTMTLRATHAMRATGSAALEWVATSWNGGGPCSFTIDGIGSILNAAGAGQGFSLAPVSRTSPAVNITLRYDPGVPQEQTTIICPETDPVIATTTAWSSYFREMHDYERDSAGFRATAQVVNAGSFTGWVYHHTTSGPGGQAVVEDTEIDIAHVPER